MKNKTLFFLLFVFTILNLTDAITSLFILPGEGNPLFLLTNSIWFVFIVKVLINGFVWFAYNYGKFSSNMTYYMFILICTMATLMLGIGCYSNISGIMNPEIVIQSAQLTTQEKATGFATLSIVFYFLPMCFSLLAFYIYDKSLNKVTIKNDRQR